MKSQLEGADLERTSGGYQIKQAGGVDKFLKKLSLFVGGESPRKLVMELAKAEKPNLQQIESLAATVQESSPDQLVPLFLEAAVVATNIHTRATFLSACAGHRYRGNPENEEEAKDTPIPSAQIANWTTLLEDERPAATVKLSGNSPQRRSNDSTALKLWNRSMKSISSILAPTPNSSLPVPRTASPGNRQLPSPTPKGFRRTCGGNAETTRSGKTRGHP